MAEIDLAYAIECERQLADLKRVREAVRRGLEERLAAGCGSSVVDLLTEWAARCTLAIARREAEPDKLHRLEWTPTVYGMVPVVSAPDTPSCRRCEGDGKAHGADRPFAWAGPGTYPGPCPVCLGTGRQPETE